MSIREVMARRLRLYRERAGMSGLEVGAAIGKSSKTVYAWESGRTQPDADTLIRLCRLYGVSISDFYTEKDSDGDSFSYVPLYGKIAAGTPIEMLSIDDTFPIPCEMAARYPDAFLLKVEGESMNRKIPNGSYALISPTAEVIDGRAYAVCVNGYDATIKRVQKLANGFLLSPDSIDPTYKPTLYDFGEEGTETITVIGRVVWYCVPFDYDI